MHFSCSACGRAYSIADEKVQGRSFRVTCRQCGAEIRVAGTRAAAPAPGKPPVAAAPRPPAPPPVPPRPPPPAPQVHLTPPTTQVAGQGAAPPAGITGMTDEEMAWLGGGTPRPRPSLATGSTTDVEAGEAALSALESGTTFPGSGSSALDGTPDELPPLPGSDESPEAPAAEGARRGPRVARIAAAAALGLAAAGVAAWQLGWLTPAPAAPPPRPPPVVTATPPVAPPEPPAPQPAPTAEQALVPDAAASVATVPEPAVISPAPAPGATKAPARSQRTRDGRNLRITSKDRRLLDLLVKKGDSAPVAGVEKSALDTGLELDQPAVERTLAENRPAFAACVTRALTADPGLDVDRKATLLLTVRPDGTVSRAWLAESDLEGTTLGKCLISAGRRVVFPAFQGETLEVAAPLALGAIR